jgi:hypothetical protein
MPALLLTLRGPLEFFLLSQLIMAQVPSFSVLFRMTVLYFLLAILGPVLGPMSSVVSAHPLFFSAFIPALV